MSPRNMAISEIAFGICLIAFSALIYIGALELPAPKYEPLGSAALPKILAALMALLSAVMIGRAAINLRAIVPTNAGQSDSAVKRHYALSLIVFLTTIAFVAIMDFGLLGFNVAGIIFLSFVCWLMTHRDLKKLPWIVGYAVILVTGCTYVFTEFFYIDLP